MRVAACAGLTMILTFISTSVQADNPLRDNSPSDVGEASFEDFADPEIEWQANASQHPGCGVTCGTCPLPVFHQVERMWAQMDYVQMWSTGNRLPPLVTTSPPNTPRAEAGVLGLDSTAILLGNQRVDDDVRSGGRITAGFWLCDCQCWGVEASWFSLDEGDSTNFGESSDGPPILARPFFNVGLNAQDSQLVAFPDVVSGQIGVLTNSDIDSGGVVVRRLWRCSPQGRMDLLFGYRYMGFDEELLIRENLVSTNPGGVLLQGTTFDVFDQFDTENDFHGVDLGVALKLTNGCLTFDATAKLAVGAVHQQLDVRGGTTVTVPNELPVSSNGGLLALPTNIGPYDNTEFGLLPELDLQLQYCLRRGVSLSVGYSLMVLNNVLRTGD